MKPFVRNLIVACIALLPVLYLALVWNGLPETVPVHFGLDGTADRMGSRSELWFTCLLLAMLSYGTYLLMVNIHRIDPKRVGKQVPGVFPKLAIGVIVFMAAINIFLIRVSQTGKLSLTETVFPLIGLLFVFLGNYMPALKPNYFAGIRLPWTLSDNDNWRSTHQLAGKIWFWGGLLFAITSVFLPVKAATTTMIVVVALMLLIPSVHSFLFFRHKQREN